jgi:glycosyltransferase involved in cell wall biosynthesis
MRGKPIRVLNNSLALAFEGHELVIATYALGQDIQDYLPEKFRDAARRIEIHRVRPGFPIDPHRPGMSVGKCVNNLSLYWLARRLLRKQRFDALICHDADGMLLGLALKRRVRLPMIYDMHGSLTELMRNIHDSRGLVLNLARRVERRLYAGADLILANWPHLTEVIGAGDAAKVCLVQDRPPLTTTESFHVQAGESQWKRKNGIDRLLVYAGNYAPYQRVDLLIDMMAILTKQQVSATLCLIGPGSENLESNAQQHADADIRFLGPRYGDDLVRILASADVALSPRVTVNYPPMKVISYLTAAIPIVGTDCAAHRMMIDDGVTGLLVPATPEAFAGAVSRLLGDEALRAKLGEAAGLQAGGYTMESLVTELRAALSRLPGQAPRSVL